jgi:hypothetical protein
MRCSQDEQTEVEGYWIKKGLLLPAFHKKYWMGARVSADEAWPVFRWVLRNERVTGALAPEA